MGSHIDRSGEATDEGDAPAAAPAAEAAPAPAADGGTVQEQGELTKYTVWCDPFGVLRLTLAGSAPIGKDGKPHPSGQVEVAWFDSMTSDAARVVFQAICKGREAPT